MYKRQLDNPAEENVFKQLRLNMWVSSLTRFIPEHIYNLGNQPIDMEALKGRDCYGGLDLSSTGDITAFVLMFPPRIPEEKYIMLPFFWIPEDTIPQRVRRASVPYDVWYQQGYLMATEGNVIHYGFIEKVIEELGKTCLLYTSVIYSYQNERGKEHGTLHLRDYLYTAGWTAG